MHIRLDAGDPVIVQGAPGEHSARQLRLMRDYGTNVVALVIPDPEVADASDVPIYRSCVEAVAATGARATVTMVRPDATARAVLEAAEAGIGLLLSQTFLVPLHDTMRVRRRLRDLGAVWIGPGSAGLAIPNNSINLGIIPKQSLQPGSIGVIAKNSTLSYEVGRTMVRNGYGQSVWVGVGIDPMKGTRPAELVPFFAEDEDTEAVVMVGGLGDDDEEAFAAALHQHGFHKPVLALLSGERGGTQYADFLRVLETRLSSSFAAKRTALEDVGVGVYDNIDDLVGALPNNVKS